MATIKKVTSPTVTLRRPFSCPVQPQMLFKNDPDGDSDLEPGYRPGVAEEDEKEEY